MSDHSDDVIRPASEGVHSSNEEGTILEDVHGHKFVLRPGWVVPRDHVPPPTYWPTVMALAITFVAFGIVTTVIITFVGFVMFAIALAGWIGDILNERREQQEHK
ncbi:MAG TPA: cytochrome c oxidase subunit 4 [Chloroflexia bacterium]|nr:cytochrome c oxidase subunit 4 [Chloroflexia bacterium]